MGLFCGKRCECRRRAKSWFSEQPDMERAAIKACSDDSSLTREKFLCSGQYVDQQTYMLSYGHDPCPNDDITMDAVLDPSNSFEKEQEWFDDMLPVFLGMGVILLVAVLALAYTLKK